jgi:hypothetical protein
MPEFNRSIRRQFGVSRRQDDRKPWMACFNSLREFKSVIIADWAAKNSVKRVVTMVNDFAPRLEAETSFKERFARPAARWSKQYASRWRIPISLRSCGVRGMPLPMPSSPAPPVAQPASQQK